MSDQMGLWGKAPARPTDPETSHMAAETIDRTPSQNAVLAALMEIGPMPHHVIVGILRERISESRCRTAVKELRDLGLVQDSGRRVVTRSGRQAVVWEATSG